jgi:single-strand DNA-binding protein
MILAMGAARLGRDVELRYTPSGDAVTNLSLAFSYGKKGDDGKRPTTWVDATLWGKRAEALAPYLLKGGQVTVTLEDLHLESFKGREGGEMWKLVGRVLDIELGSSGAPAGQEAPARPVQRAPAPAPGRAPGRAPVPPAAGSGFDSMSDDIPF